MRGLEAGRAMLFALSSLVLAFLLLYFSWAVGRFSAISLSNDELRFSAALSLTTSSFATLVSIFTALPVAHALARRPGIAERAALALLILPSALSPAAVGLLLLIFFTQTSVGGALNELFSFVNDPKGVALVQLVIAYPTALGVLAPMLGALGEEYEEVAATLGYGRLEALYRLIAPMLGRELGLASLLVFARTLGEFGGSYIVGGAIRMRTETLPIALYYASTYGDIPTLASALTLYTLIVLAIVFAAGYMSLGVVRRD
ncbi:MAG: ABC transporter permease subunit [Desulfurococcaceae archaeon]